MALKMTGPSAFSERLQGAIERWVEVLPLHLREQFRKEFGQFADSHDRTMATIEAIWKRRDRRLARDEATGLARRRPFQDHLASMLAMPASHPYKAVGILFIDVNNLKAVNDTYGHKAGDKALAVVGRAIREAIRVERTADFSTRATPEDDDYSVSRHGGDEFLIALELDGLSSIEAAAPRIKRRVENPEEQKAAGYHFPMTITVSMGGVVYALPESAPPMAPNRLARELIAAADEQMYAAKRDGRIHIVTARFTDRIEVDRGRAQALVSF